MPEVPLAARAALLAQAGRHGLLRVASFTTGEAAAVREAGLLAQVDLLALNLEEAAALGEIARWAGRRKTLARAAVEALSRLQPGIRLSITGGKDGSWTWDGRRDGQGHDAALHHVPAYPVDAVSTAGAGDAHLAGLLAGLAAGLALGEAQELAGPHGRAVGHQPAHDQQADRSSIAAGAGGQAAPAALPSRLQASRIGVIPMMIDAHTHVFPQYAGLAVEAMDRAGIAWSVTLEWHDGFGDTLKRHLETFNAYDGRFVVFGNVDWRQINEKGFAARAARQMAEDAAAGMAGLKIYKALGLEYRHENGEFWRIDDPALDDIWAQAGELGIPVLIHTADPKGFWEPMTERNPWNGVVYGEYAWWGYYRKDYPCPDTLLGERNEVIARHPRTTFICPHVGSKDENLEAAAEDLDAFPNLYYDISARLPELGRTPRRAARSREFFLAYQDRLLFGTDCIYDDTNVPTGMQAQCLYQPGEFPLAGADSLARYVETTVDFVRSHVEFLATGHAQENPPFKRSQQGYTMYGLDLPGEVCEKVWERNVRRVLKR